MFPYGTLQERMKICADQDVKMFCKDYVEKAEIMFIVATAACFLIILSLVSSFLTSIQFSFLFYICKNFFHSPGTLFDVPIS